MTEGSDKAEDSKAEQPGTDEADTGKRGRWGAAGLGAAIGSAAIVAALLYVNRSKGKDSSRDKGKS